MRVVAFYLDLDKVDLIYFCQIKEKAGVQFGQSPAEQGTNGDTIEIIRRLLAGNLSLLCAKYSLTGCLLRRFRAAQSGPCPHSKKKPPLPNVLSSR
ncbi:hypothetical protein PUN4_760043 [Paraburkholderia unamae]|nr:hypothetical protein PUN4_760043 [Paraburkholderia unamae]